MRFKKERMDSFMLRGNTLLTGGKTKDAIELVEKGPKYYSDKIINAISPYAQADAGMIVLVLRHIADEVERNNPGAKQVAAGLGKSVRKPTLTETTKHQKPNRR